MGQGWKAEGDTSEVSLFVFIHLIWFWWPFKALNLIMADIVNFPGPVDTFKKLNAMQMLLCNIV